MNRTLCPNLADVDSLTAFFSYQCYVLKPEVSLVSEIIRRLLRADDYDVLETNAEVSISVVSRLYDE